MNFWISQYISDRVTNGQGNPGNLGKVVVNLEKSGNFINISWESGNNTWNHTLESAIQILFMLCYRESKWKHKMVSAVFCHTMSLVCELLLALHKLYNWVKLVASFYLILILVFGSALKSVDRFLSCDLYLGGNTVSRNIYKMWWRN